MAEYKERRIQNEQARYPIKERFRRVSILCSILYHSELSKVPVSSGDLAEFGKQVFYVLDAFREHIVDALENR